jgi:hypothetical protein
MMIHASRTPDARREAVRLIAGVRGQESVVRTQILGEETTRPAWQAPRSVVLQFKDSTR